MGLLLLSSPVQSEIISYKAPNTPCQFKPVYAGKECYKKRSYDTEHLVLKCSVLSHGVLSEYSEILNSYNLQSIDKQRSGIIRLFDGAQDGESGGCERHEFLKLKEAVTGSTITYEDINKDSYDDIIVTVHKQNCETKKKVSHTKKYYASKHGFNLSR